MAGGVEVGLRCRCGAVRGIARDVGPSTINRCVCYCDDCQAFVHFLGRADDIFDAHAGTEIVQMSQGAIAWTEGVERIAAVRLTAKGLLRWYAGCCRTPLGNTLATAGLPFIGMVRAAIDAPAEALGPIRGRVFANSAKGGRAAVPRGGLPEPVMLLRVLAKLVGWRLRGEQKGSALFEPGTGRPLVEPRVLTSAEREDLRRRCAEWRGESAAGGAA